MSIQWLEEVEKRKEELIQDLVKFIQIKSELVTETTADAPFGTEIRRALDFTLEMGQRDGMEVKNVENVAGHVEFGKGTEYVGILGHVDVVPAGNDWSFDPYGAEIKDGKIYGRGTQDDKGPTIAAYYGMKIVKELGLELSKRVRLVVGCDEESGWRCLPRYFELEERPALGFVPDAEFPLIYGEKGIMVWELTGKESKNSDLVSFQSGFRNNMVPDFAEVTLTGEQYVSTFESFCKEHQYAYSAKVESGNSQLRITGKSAHGAQPSKGINAAFLMIEYFSSVSLTNDFVDMMNKYLLNDVYGEKIGIAFEHEEMGKVSVNTGIVEFSNGAFKVVLNPRYPKGFDALSQVEKAKQNLASSNVTLNVVKHTPLMYIDPNGPLVQTLHQVYLKHTNDRNSKLMTIGGGTYSRLTPNVVAFGAQFPGYEDRMHQLDEYAVIDDILKATAIYAEAIYELAK